MNEPAVRIIPVLFAFLLAISPVSAQDEEAAPDAAPAASAPTAPSPDVAKAMREKSLEILISMQEGPEKSEWPYEGVYAWGDRTRPGVKIIPLGYRAGGTSIAALQLLETPGYAADRRRHEPVHRAARAVLALLDEDLMSPGFAGDYDVRGWGHAYALLFFLRLREAGGLDEALDAQLAKANRRLVLALQEMAIPENGGWNYSLRRGFGNPRNAASPFMTGPTLQALFLAKRAGLPVETRVVDEALAALERGRTESGGYSYSSSPRPRALAGKDEEALGMMDKKPGSSGRMCVVEATLALAGRGDVARIRDAVETFFAHHDALKVRKQQNGTHIPPYGVAPYYFMYAHYYCAQAIEQLPAEERAAWRARLAATLVAEQEPDGGWNDRVFPRSRNYGTAMGLGALVMAEMTPPARWIPDAKKDD
ncbi:MAG: prenyltransferase/squalene oxidase repeat-containing protein [Planctomycetota bacterium]